MEINVTKCKVLVDFEIKEDGRAHIFIKHDGNLDMDMDNIAKVLAGGLSLAVRGSSNQGKLMKGIMDYLYDEFVSVDSFKDLKVFKSED